MTVMEHTKAAQIDLAQYGITGVTELVRNPSYDMKCYLPKKPVQISKVMNVVW